jgi:hypothetical protein
MELKRKLPPLVVYGLFLNRDKEGTELLGIYSSHVKGCVAASLYVKEQEENDVYDQEKNLQIRALDVDQNPDTWYAIQSRNLPI